MKIGDVMDQVAAQLASIPQLSGRVFAYPPGSVVPPAAVVSYPDQLIFDETYGRGMDRLTLPVMVMVGRPTERSTRDHLEVFCEGSGPSSVKATVEQGAYSAFHTVRVEGIEFDVVTMGGNDYMTALFTLDIAGSGTA